MSYILLMIGPAILTTLVAFKMPLASALASALWLGLMGWSVPDQSRWLFFGLASFMLAWAVSICIS
jgi:hypothetical protein